MNRKPGLSPELLRLMALYVAIAGLLAVALLS